MSNRLKEHKSKIAEFKGAEKNTLLNSDSTTLNITAAKINLFMIVPVSYGFSIG